MALVTTVSGVIGVLAAITLLLWFSAYIESHHLGPVAGPADEPVPVPEAVAVAVDGPVALAADAVYPAA